MMKFTTLTYHALSLTLGIRTACSPCGLSHAKSPSSGTLLFLCQLWAGDGPGTPASDIMPDIEKLSAEDPLRTPDFVNPRIRHRQRASSAHAIRTRLTGARGRRRPGFAVEARAPAHAFTPLAGRGRGNAHPGAGRPSDHLRIVSTAQSTVGFYEIFVRNLDQLPPRSPTSCAIRLLSSATLVPSMTDTSRVP